MAFIVRLELLFIVRLWHLAALAMMGLRVTFGIVTLVVVSGTADKDQLPAVSHAVLTDPVQLELQLCVVTVTVVEPVHPCVVPVTV